MWCDDKCQSQCDDNSQGGFDERERPDICESAREAQPPLRFNPHSGIGRLCHIVKMIHSTNLLKTCTSSSLSWNMVSGLCSKVSLTYLNQVPHYLRYLTSSETLPQVTQYLRYLNNSVTSMPELPHYLRYLNTSCTSIPQVPQYCRYITTTGTAIPQIPQYCRQYLS